MAPLVLYLLLATGSCSYAAESHARHSPAPLGLRNGVTEACEAIALNL